MKGMDIFCASHAATAIRLSTMDETPPASSSSSSSSSSTSVHHLVGCSGRAIDRYNPIIRDERRILKPLIPPPNCSQNPPPPPTTTELPKHHHKKSSKKETTTGSSGRGKDNTSKTKKRSSKKDEKSSVRKSSSSTKTAAAEAEQQPQPITNARKSITSISGSWSCTRVAAGGFISPPGGSSRRYLLSDKSNLLNNHVFSDFDPTLLSLSAAVQKEIQTPPPPPAADPPTPSSSPHQVVVLRVSLHCRGCERKMRKHISRMEGVTSFNIDFAAKKVTVVGAVTPLSVLASISKVKNAQLLTPTISSSPAPPPAAAASDYTETKNTFYDKKD